MKRIRAKETSVSHGTIKESDIKSGKDAGEPGKDKATGTMIQGMAGGITKGMAAITAAVLITSCAGPGGRNRTATEPPTVTVETVRKVMNPHTDSYIGEVKASKSAVLTARHGGTLSGLNVSQGDIVRQGEVVAEVDSRAVQSAYEAAQATLKQAEDGYGRLLKVYGNGSVADVKLIEVETQLAKARAAMAAAEQALEDCRIKAPFSGTVSETYVERGVAVGMTEPLMRIVDIATVEVRIPVPEAEVGRVSVGQTAHMDVPALSLEGMEVEVSSKGVTASPFSHTYDCILKPRGKVEGLMPGMVCKVYMDKEGQDAIVIPASTIRNDADGRYVWLADAGDKVRKVHVVTGGFSGNGVIVTEGLEEGDRLIVEGAYKVSSGMRVNAVEKE